MTPEGFWGQREIRFLEASGWSLPGITAHLGLRLGLSTVLQSLGQGPDHGEMGRNGPESQPCSSWGLAPWALGPFKLRLPVLPTNIRPAYKSLLWPTGALMMGLPAPDPLS